MTCVYYEDNSSVGTNPITGSTLFFLVDTLCTNTYIPVQNNTFEFRSQISGSIQMLEVNLFLLTQKRKLLWFPIIVMIFYSDEFCLCSVKYINLFSQNRDLAIDIMPTEVSLQIYKSQMCFPTSGLQAAVGNDCLKNLSLYCHTLVVCTVIRPLPYGWSFEYCCTADSIICR